MLTILRTDPFLDKISGSFVDEKGNELGKFSRVADVIGGKSPDPKKNVRDYLRDKFPGKLIVELPGAPKDLGTVNVILEIPDDLECPQGTSPAIQPAK